MASESAMNEITESDLYAIAMESDTAYRLMAELLALLDIHRAKQTQEELQS
jgi:hypothetical protein